MAGKETPKPLSKSEVIAALAESTGLAKKDISSVLTELGTLIAKNIGKKGPGAFALPGLMKITVTRRPATKAGTRANPFKPGEMMKVAAKPARNVVKIRPLKSMKEMV